MRLGRRLSVGVAEHPPAPRPVEEVEEPAPDLADDAVVEREPAELAER